LVISRRDRKGVSTVIGTLFFVVILLTSFSVMLLTEHARYDYDQTAAEMNLFDQESISEDLEFYMVGFDDYLPSNYSYSEGTVVASGNVQSLERQDNDFLTFYSNATGGFIQTEQEPIDGGLLNDTTTVAGGYSNLRNKDSVYWQMRSYPSGTYNTIPYYPSNYSLLGSTTYISGSISDLETDNGAYMTFRSYVNGSTIGSQALAVWGENNINTPQYRVWDGGTWGSESSTLSVGGEPEWVVVKACPTRDEKIMGVLDYSGHINVQVYSDGSWHNLTEVTTALASYDQYRGFDIVYEHSSGDAMLVYQNNVNDPVYRVWNGSSWSSPTTIDLLTGGRPVWINLEAKPDADEIILATLDAGRDVCAAVWDGDNWGNTIRLETNTETYTQECIDIAYEYSSGYAMVAWSDGGQTSGGPQYRFWQGASWGSESTAPATGNEPRWIRLASDTSSDRILMACVDDGRDINVNVWLGSSWYGNQEFDSGVETYTSRCFDVAWEKSGNQAVVVYGDSGDHTPDYRTWDGSWSSSLNTPDVGNDVKILQLVSKKESDEIFMMTLSDDSDINIERWTGSSFTSATEFETNAPSYNYEVFMVAPDAHLNYENVVNLEFNGTSDLYSWTELEWTVDSRWTVGAVDVTLQLYDYDSSMYPTSGDGYDNFVSSSTPNDQTGSQTITTNPTYFRDTDGNWIIRVTGVWDSSEVASFDFKPDFVEFKVTYFILDTYAVDWYADFYIPYSGIYNFTARYWGYYTEDDDPVEQTMYAYNYYTLQYDELNTTTYPTAYTGNWQNVTVDTSIYDYIQNGNLRIKVRSIYDYSTFDAYADYLNIEVVYWSEGLINWCGKIPVNTTGSQISRLDVTYVGHFSTVSDLNIYIYNFTSNSWLDLTSSRTGSPDVITGPISASGTPSHYISPSDEVWVSVNSTCSQAFYCYGNMLNVKIYPTPGNGHLDIKLTNKGGRTVHLVDLMIANNTSHMNVAQDVYISPGETWTYQTGYAYSWTSGVTYTIKAISDRGNTWSYSVQPA